LPDWDDLRLARQEGTPQSRLLRRHQGLPSGDTDRRAELILGEGLPVERDSSRGTRRAGSTGCARDRGSGRPRQRRRTEGDA
jgi:hypothetical protein